MLCLEFSGGSVAKNVPANAGDTGSIPGSGRCPGEGNGNLLQYSCLDNPTDRGAWQVTVPWGHKESDMTELIHAHMHTHTYIGVCAILVCIFLFCFKYLFIWLLQVLVVVRGLLSSCGRWAPEPGGSVVVAHGHSCPAACGILVLPTRDRTCTPCIGRQILNQWASREVPVWCGSLNIFIIKMVVQ